MILRRLVPIAIVLAGLSLLAVLGSGGVSRDRDARLDAARREVDQAAAEIAAAAEVSLGAVARDLRAGGSGRRYFLTAERAVLPAPPPPPLDEAERSALEHALAVGGQLRAADEPLRAIDAYTIALPRLESSAARDRLRWAAASTALETETMRAWGRATLEQLAAGGSGTEGSGTGGSGTGTAGSGTETGEVGGTPIDLLARLALPADATPPVTAATLRARLSDVSADRIEALAARFSTRPGWIDHPELDREIAARRGELRSIIAAEPRLRRGLPSMTDGHLIVPIGDGNDGAVVELRILDVSRQLPTVSSPRSVTFDPPTTQPTISVEATPIASVLLDDPRLPHELEAIGSRATRLRLLLFAVLVTVGIAVLVTWFAIDRQRRLAALKMRLLANVSHELKTPVTSIRMFGELLGQGRLPPERVQEFGRRITKEAQRLGMRIEEILETARSEKNRTPLVRAPLALPSVIDEVVGNFRPRVAEAKGALAFESAPATTTVETNRDALEQIVENLIDNALKYATRPDREQGPQITVTVAGDEGRAQVVVEDDGPGVPSGDRERIFEPFYRARYDDFSVTGTGLGLSISRSFAERLGGSLDHAAVPSGGSRFTLTLPCRLADGAGNAREGETS